MEKAVDHVRLVKKAQLGDKESLDRLTELAGERLRVDVFRLTLQGDLTQEIVQESLFEMFKVLSDLKEAHRFWPWLYKIALNKIRLHYRSEQRRRTVTASAMAQKDGHKDGRQVMANVIGQELKEIVLAAMRRLKPRHRAVLTMRCYREMEYSQIAESMGCSEFAAKMLFYRAKKSLRKQLSRFGFGKGLLLPALVLFGKITAPSKAAAAQVTVTAASTKIGLATGLVGFATSKSGIVSLAAAGILAVGTTAVTLGPEHTGQKSLSIPPAGGQAGALSKGVEEYWYYYPRGANGPVMMRLVKWDPQEKRSYCQWLQNEQATYYFDNRKGTVYIKNHRMWRNDMAVWRLPTDPPQEREFLSRVEGTAEPLQHVRPDGAGLLVIVRRNENGNISRAAHHYNVLDEQYFRYGWPTNTPRVDSRDEMHIQKGCYFTITGKIDGKAVSGTGRMPFVDAAKKQYNPFLKLQVAGGVKIMDSGAEARVYDRSGKLVKRYRGGGFFAGLARPWMGLHTIDTVRRDAAREQIWFETRQKRDANITEIILTGGQAKLIYTINMEKDIIETITFSTDDGHEGILRFSYLQDIDQKQTREFVSPRWRSSGRPQQERPGMLWLVKLVNGRW